ncbi:hypothetical protein GQ55_6G283600 [Panicum hallii var. hallii]|uniref:Uncharacterized protein n=1 Tax=Panicum hallii var. hallii TaxID=1504633 RepID=A0A2T7DAH2_9POAL|nr:hypothetical protein GQ55_6G283600 [Panicum hallii var. hallii]
MEAEVVKPPPVASVSVSMSSVSPSASAAGPAGAGGEFTADDLAAADQLVQLSVSGGGDDDEEDDQHEAFSSSSSSRSVNNAARGEVEDAEDSGVVDRRVRKRYRLVSELYAATRQVKAGAGARGKSKRNSSTDGIPRK